MSRESLMEVLKEGGPVESLLTPPAKPYAFVTYSSTEAGQNACTLLNGRALQCHDQTVMLYFSYVEKGICHVSFIYNLFSEPYNKVFVMDLNFVCQWTVTGVCPVLCLLVCLCWRNLCLQRRSFSCFRLLIGCHILMMSQVRDT